MARRSFAPRGAAQRGPRRLTAWSQVANQAYIAVPAVGSTLLASISFETPGTIVRVRGQVSVKLATYAADLDIVGAFGMGVVSAEALGIGVTAVPTPFSDADWGGWMVWRSFSAAYEVGSGNAAIRGSWEFEIDSKAMRKVEANSALVFVAESQSGDFELSSPLRVLVMLH